TYPDASEVNYAYDDANRLITVTNSFSEQAAYTYQAGRLTGFTNFNGIQTAYAYDQANRLTGIASSVANYQFTLDANGNRLLSAGPLAFTYDDEGQLNSAGDTPYIFDSDRRLAAIGSTAQFFYDGTGKRLKAVRSGVTTRYIYDPWGNLLAEADALNRITRKYIYGNGLLSVVTPDARYCYHFNATGSTVALTDMSQAVVNSYAYDPFGVILGRQETISQPFKFVGQYGVMAEPSPTGGQTGLYYMRARYYDPNVGRFISEDPIGFAGGDVNLSAHVRNQPLDQQGRRSKEDPVCFHPWKSRQ
ncbi:MAG: RHS repeat-associated core domain-containing protein, partial [Bacillota bacterium]